MLARKLLFGITVLASLALPVLGHMALEADNHTRGLQLRLADLESQHRQLVDYERHVERYRAHLGKLERFSAAAREAGVGPEHWDTHQVDIDDMFVSYFDLEAFIVDVSSNADSFFIPEKLSLEVRPTVTHEDIAADAGTRTPFEGGVSLSLKGKYLVER